MEKIKAWFKHSMTILWARILWIGGILAGGVAAVFATYDYTDLLNLTWPKFIQICGAVIIAGAVAEVMRRRTLPKPGE